MINTKGPLLFPKFATVIDDHIPIQSQELYFLETYQISRAYARIVVGLFWLT